MHRNRICRRPVHCLDDASRKCRRNCRVQLAAGTPCVVTDPDPANANSIAAFRKAGFRALATRDTPWGHVLLMRCDNSDPATAK